MAINGTIGVSALFHDTDGTTTINVVSLESSNAYTTGKVAIVTGTAGTAAVSLGNIKGTTYRGADGQQVVFNEINQVAFRITGEPRVCTVTAQFDGESYGSLHLVSGGGVAISDINKSGLALEADADYAAVIQPLYNYGTTGTYTILIYGT